MSEENDLEAKNKSENFCENFRDRHDSIDIASERRGGPPFENKRSKKKVQRVFK